MNIRPNQKVTVLGTDGTPEAAGYVLRLAPVQDPAGYVTSAKIETDHGVQYAPLSQVRPWAAGDPEASPRHGETLPQLRSIVAVSDRSVLFGGSRRKLSVAGAWLSLCNARAAAVADVPAPAPAPETSVGDILADVATAAGNLD